MSKSQFFKSPSFKELTFHKPEKLSSEIENANQGKIYKPKHPEMLQIKGELDNNTGRLVEAAIPAPGPVSPNKKRNLMTGIVLGLAAGFGLALFLDYKELTLDIINIIHAPNFRG